MAPQLPDIQTRDVALMSGDADLLTPWIDQFNIASENATTLLNTFSEAPFVGGQQAIADLSNYAQQLLDDPENINSVTQQLQQNLADVLQGFTLQGQVGLPSQTGDLLTEVIKHTLAIDGPFPIFGHHGILNYLPQFIPASIPYSDVQPIINFLASPSSGILIGELGPAISPVVALINSVDAGDDWNTTLADMVGAFFNGATLNLNGLLPLIQEAGIFPQGLSMTNLDFGFGGLLTPGDVSGNGYEVGGSIFNSLGITLTGAAIPGGGFTLPAEPVGPLGAWEGWDQTIAALLGWDGSGSPLADVTLPTIPVDFLDGGTSAATAATDLSSLWQDLIAAF